MNTPKMPALRSPLTRTFLPFAVAVLAPLWLVASCQASPDATSAEVLTAHACPSGYPCALYANGASLVTVEGCLAENVSHPRADLAVEFRLTAGTWSDPKPANPTDASIRVPLTARCAQALFRAPYDPGKVHVVAQLADANGLMAYAQPIELLMRPQPLDALKLTTPLGYLPVSAGTLPLTAQLFSKLGRASNGTRVEFRVDTWFPTTATPRFIPDRADVTGGVDPTTVFVPDSADSVTIIAIATPPTGEDDAGAPAASVSAQLVLTKQPLPASLTVLPPSADFGSVAANSGIATTSFVVTNAVGAAQTGPMDFLVAGPPDFAVEYTSGTCVRMGTLAGGKSCTLVVQFQPKSTGIRSATLSIVGAPGTPPTATMSGTGS